MQIISPAFENGKEIPSIYTCDGSNINPPLTLVDVPDSTKSLALLVDDKDAPSGKFTHWIIWNMDRSTKEVPEGSLPPICIIGKNDFGDLRYGGPCPPSGTHKYYFVLYALDKNLDLNQGSSRSDFENASLGHILEEAILIGLYSKK